MTGAHAAEWPTNRDVTWDANFLGLAPSVPQSATEQAFELGDAAIPELIEALADPERFVAAHVLLTQVSGVEYEVEESWNGLEVELAPTGEARIDPEQRHHLADRWRAWHEASPRPKSL